MKKVHIHKNYKQIHRPTSNELPNILVATVSIGYRQRFKYVK